MSLKAQDFLPLLNNLSHEEQVRLARLALSVAAGTGSIDSDAYRKDDSLAWEAEGWEEFGGAG
jgi:hypothetical protein